jgi:hypothetical protein
MARTTQTSNQDTSPSASAGAPIGDGVEMTKKFIFAYRPEVIIHAPSRGVRSNATHHGTAQPTTSSGGNASRTGGTGTLQSAPVNLTPAERRILPRNKFITEDVTEAEVQRDMMEQDELDDDFEYDEINGEGADTDVPNLTAEYTEQKHFTRVLIN